jgi:hypothetical protein
MLSVNSVLDFSYLVVVIKSTLYFGKIVNSCLCNLMLVSMLTSKVGSYPNIHKAFSVRITIT